MALLPGCERHSRVPQGTRPPVEALPPLSRQRVPIVSQKAGRGKRMRCLNDYRVARGGILGGSPGGHVLLLVRAHAWPERSRRVDGRLTIDRLFDQGSIGIVGEVGRVAALNGVPLTTDLKRTLCIALAPI